MKILESLEIIINYVTQKTNKAFLWQYRVVNVSSGKPYTISAEPISSICPFPAISNITVIPSIPGMVCKPAIGTICILGFIDGDDTMPVILGFSDNPGNKLIVNCDEIIFNDNTANIQGVARVTDAVQAGPFSGVITNSSTSVKVGM